MSFKVTASYRASIDFVTVAWAQCMCWSLGPRWSPFQKTGICLIATRFKVTGLDGLTWPWKRPPIQTVQAHSTRRPQVPEDRCTVSGGLEKEHYAWWLCLLNDPSLWLGWVWSLWLWWNGLWKDSVCRYLQGYPCQLGGETENTRLTLDYWI